MLFKNKINQYEYVIACIAKYNEIVALDGKANIITVVNLLKDNVKEIAKYKDIYLQNKQNSIAQSKLSDRLDFSNKHFSTTDKNCIDILSVK